MPKIVSTPSLSRTLTTACMAGIWLMGVPFSVLSVGLSDRGKSWCDADVQRDAGARRARRDLADDLARQALVIDPALARNHRRGPPEAGVEPDGIEHRRRARRERRADVRPPLVLRDEAQPGRFGRLDRPRERVRREQNGRGSRALGHLVSWAVRRSGNAPLRERARRRASRRSPCSSRRPWCTSWRRTW